MNSKENIIILGGGQTAAYAARTIRELDKSPSITIISDENFLPYERPPLSKDFLLEKNNYDQGTFFSNDFYNDQKITVLRNKKIVDVDFDHFLMKSATNDLYKFDKLLIATGSKNRKINIKNINNLEDDNFYYLRDIKESQIIKEKLKISKEILVLGGGFIGLEIASSANQLGKKVHVVELGKQLMGRVIPEKIANIIQSKHENEGTNFYLNDQVKHIKKNNNLYEVILNSNKTFLVDMIIVGIGASPNIELFKESSLEIDNGIVTNEFCQTSITNVYASGDVANFFHPFYGSHMRLESFKHAQNHGINAGKNIMNVKTSYTEIPWMWSDQFNLNLQMTGICNDFDSFVQRGNDVKSGVIYFFLKNRKILGACGVGVGGKIGRDIRLAGKISEKKIKITKEILSNRDYKLNDVLKN